MGIVMVTYNCTTGGRPETSPGQHWRDLMIDMLACRSEHESNVW
jgi:hypothetical protein